jgi:NTE family protein
MEHKHPWTLGPPWSGVAETLSYWSTVLNGIPGFFRANPAAFLGQHVPLGVDGAGYYSTAPLRKTLSELVDFSLINQCRSRLTVGAAHVRTSTMRYFDSREGRLPPTTSWRRALCRRHFPRCSSTESVTGTVASCPTRRPG